MPRQLIQELKDGDSIDEVYLLADKQLRTNRNADLYLLATLRDSSGQINGMMWNVTQEATAHYDGGDYVHVHGKVQLYQGSLQIIIKHIRAVESEQINPADFQPRSNIDTQTLMERMREILLGIDDPPLHTLMEVFLVDEELMTSFCEAPAGIKAHHAYHGGLLEHVVNILETALRIAGLYPAVDINLLLAGAFLHDIGKVRELGYEASMTYTDEGQLLGHMMIGVEMLTQKIANVERLNGEKFPEETSLRLKHMILSHHGRLEYGSAKLPMTPEAIALHHLDNLDAKVHEFSRSIADDPNTGSSFTPYSNRLERKLFKGISSK